MKYMGSKKAMLRNGLGELLEAKIGGSSRFVDLFTGSGAVAIHASATSSVPVFAYDLQAYSVVLANAVIARQRQFDARKEWLAWSGRASQLSSDLLRGAPRVSPNAIERHRKWSASQDLPITAAYGGHYFSAKQSIWLDALRATMPTREPIRTSALASIITAASKCAAAPGHTAQPFQPTPTALPFLLEAWGRDIPVEVGRQFHNYGTLFARTKGQASVRDANDAARDLQKEDLVFIDPPYSGVQYSRFYHVLETLAAGLHSNVSGVGRYPARTERPQSQYSLKNGSAKAFDGLLSTIAERGARAIVTFPDHKCSNGLSGALVRAIASKYFRVVERTIESRFSTLGGTSQKAPGARAARQHARELVLYLD